MQTTHKTCTKCGLDKPPSTRHHKGGEKREGWWCKDCTNEYFRAYRKRKPAQHMLTQARRRAKEKGLPFTIDETHIVIPAVCPILGIKMESNWGVARPTDNSPSLDRVDNAKGYTPDNIIVISNRANTLKRDGTLAEFRKLVEFLESR